MSRIIIGGDCVPTHSNERFFIEGNVSKLFGSELIEIFKNSELNIVNLEVSLCRQQTPILKRGQINTAHPDTCNALKELGVDLCLLANNHVIDNGEEGLISTIEALKKYGIKYIGAGLNIKQAKKPYQTIINGKKIIILNVSDHEFNAANNNKYGVYVYDPLDIFDQIEEYSKNSDLLIVIFHGGIEHYRFPTPNLQKICRKMIDKGAWLVTCQHSHCIGTYEDYNNGKIIYGQGNFLFDEDELEMHQTAILLQLDIQDIVNISFIPVKKDKECVKLADDREKVEILSAIEKRHELIKNEKNIYKLFQELCQKKQVENYNVLLCYNKLFKLINKITLGAFYTNLFNKFNKLRILNHLESNALQEVLIEIMKMNEGKND